jgi:hypothetical protein
MVVGFISKVQLAEFVTFTSCIDVSLVSGIECAANP